VVRERFFAPRLRMASDEELNAWLLDRCVAYAKAHKHPQLTEGSNPLPCTGESGTNLTSSPWRAGKRGVYIGGTLTAIVFDDTESGAVDPDPRSAFPSDNHVVRFRAWVQDCQTFWR